MLKQISLAEKLGFTNEEIVAALLEESIAEESLNPGKLSITLRQAAAEIVLQH